MSVLHNINLVCKVLFAKNPSLLDDVKGYKPCNQTEKNYCSKINYFLVYNSKATSL